MLDYFPSSDIIPTSHQRSQTLRLLRKGSRSLAFVLEMFRSKVQDRLQMSMAGTEWRYIRHEAIFQSIVIRMRKMEVLRYGKMFFVLSRVWDKEKILSPNEESNLRPTDSAPRCSTTGPQRLYGEHGLLRSQYMTRVLHTVRISNLDSVMFCK